ncbi:MAG: hypothetical protein Q4E84_05510 [Clostridia bacterium]|nr:hypothetical protein [Clostridia bacterium]
MEKKIIASMLLSFFILMIVFTFVSRNTAITLLPEVTTMNLEEDGWIAEGAVREDDTGRYYVFILTEKESILGKTAAVNKLPVVMEEKSDGMVKLKDISKYSTFEFVTDVSEELSDGDRVRRK